MTDIHLSPIEDIIADATDGKMFILVDDEDRENEGDLVIPAARANAEAINFMAKYGRGLICLALTEKRVGELNIPLMSPHNQTRHQTAFTVSIEAREGITTGISVADRARTVAVAIDPEKSARDIISPGHVFPLVARDGGVLVRAGHTEAAVDIARMAGLNPSGVICEIMNDDGTMARLPDLIPFAKTHGLRIATIADLIAYRRRAEKLVQKTLEKSFTSRFGGEFTMKVYTNILTRTEHVVFQKGTVSPDKPTLVRMHAVDLLSDLMLGNAPSSGYLQAALNTIGEHGSGVLVLLREPKPDAISARESKEGLPPEIRDYGIGAQILLDLGIRDMTLLSNSKRQIVGLEGYGLNIVGYHPISPLSL